MRKVLTIVAIMAIATTSYFLGQKSVIMSSQEKVEISQQATDEALNKLQQKPTTERFSEVQEVFITHKGTLAVDYSLSLQERLQAYTQAGGASKNWISNSISEGRYKLQNRKGK